MDGLPKVQARTEPLAPSQLVSSAPCCSARQACGRVVSLARCQQRGGARAAERAARILCSIPIGCLWSSFTGESRQSQLGGRLLKSKLNFLRAVLSVRALSCL